MERVGSYNITEYLGGKAEDAIKLNLWSLPNAETMQQLGEDLDYQALEAKRNALHDFSQITLYTASSVQDSIDTNADLFLVDLVVMNDGYGLEERNEYEAAILPIAEKNGLQRTHFYEALNYINGAVEDAIKLNLWALPVADAMEQLVEAPEYQAFIPRRDEIHDFESLTLYLAEPVNQKSRSSQLIECDRAFLT
ncbi:MAG: hypothetical protein AAF704_09850 [Cyanobacteria bacterium P01_D01_bin.123]